MHPTNGQLHLSPQLEYKYVWRQIHSDLTFLLEQIFQIPHTHVYECLKTFWERTYRLWRPGILFSWLNLTIQNACGSGPATTGWYSETCIYLFAKSLAWRSGCRIRRQHYD
jgi:hypothetical protein